VNGDQIHFEVFIRRKVNSPWTLEIATEDRSRAVETAEELLAEGRAAGVKVTKETLDPETREFRSVTVLSKGDTEVVKTKKKQDADETPLCVVPGDLYSSHARERIGRLLDGWLQRKRVTPFELLHRPDLVEELDASGVEIQHAVQKIAIPESQARGISVHELIRTFQKLIERAIERIIKDGRKQTFPVIDPSSFAFEARRLINEPERLYLLGGGVAAYLAPATNWQDKVGMLLDLAEFAPDAGPPRGLAFQVIEQLLSEMLGSRGGIAELLGQELDLGGSLAALVRLSVGKEVRALCGFDASIEKQLPPLDGHAARLAGWLERDAFDNVRAAIVKRILTELTGPRRLRPDDAEGEIAILRALAMALTAAAGKLISHEDVQVAFVERCRRLVAADFVETYLTGRESALAEAQALVRLAENMAGAANKRAAARWISASVSALRFEKDLRNGPDTPSTKLAVLAELQRAVNQAGLNDADKASAAGKIGEIAGLIEADSKLVQLVARAEAPVTHRLTLLLRLACGETAPLGPVADRARREALKLLRTAETRADLAANPEALERVRGLLQNTGLAA
jgi:hypothetical protein